MSKGYPKSAFVRGLMRGTVFFTLLLLFEVFWNVVIEDRGVLLTADNVIFAGIFAGFFVVMMHFIDVKSGRTSD